MSRPGQTRITRLALRPRRVQTGGGAHVVLVLSTAGRVVLRVQRAEPVDGRWEPTSWEIRRHLDAGRNVVSLKLAPPLPPGRYRLLARALGPSGAPGAVRRGFRVVS